MTQSAGVSFFIQTDEGATETYALTVKFDPEDEGPVITDNLGHTFVVDE